jgi:hypothetical protein
LRRSRAIGCAKQPGVAAAMPTNLVDGINYNPTDATKTGCLDAPLKDFVYVAGSFNNWQPTSAYAMRKDLQLVNSGLQVNRLSSGINL